MSTAHVCGHLLVGGFAGPEPSSTFLRALAAGERAGAVLFKRNLTGDPAQAVALTAALQRAARDDAPPLVAVDQEGGRVARLGAPVLSVPAMRTLARHGDVDLVARVAEAQARELRALGFTMNFAPVLDVNTNHENPIIGDRAFGDDPDVVIRFGEAYARGLRDGGLLACGKHFPGHGDTSKDSHLDLPVVAHDRARLERIELAPFRAAVRFGIPAMMTAHVVYPALDPERPATLSRAVSTDLLRGALGFRGVLFSDDLEMKAISARWSVEDAACEAVLAGCDVLLVCASEELQARAYEALVANAERSPTFLDRCREAAARSLAMRRSVRPMPETDRAKLSEIVGGAASQRVAAELSAIRAEVVS